MSAITRREAIQAEGGFDESIRVAPDFDLWLRMAWAGVKFAHLCTRRTQRRATAEYRVWGGNTILNQHEKWGRTAWIVRARQDRRKLETAATG